MKVNNEGNAMEAEPANVTAVGEVEEVVARNDGDIMCHGWTLGAAVAGFVLVLVSGLLPFSDLVLPPSPFPIPPAMFPPALFPPPLFPPPLFPPSLLSFPADAPFPLLLLGSHLWHGVVATVVLVSVTV